MDLTKLDIIREHNAICRALGTGDGAAFRKAKRHNRRAVEAVFRLAGNPPTMTGDQFSNLSETLDD